MKHRRRPSLRRVVAGSGSDNARKALADSRIGGFRPARAPRVAKAALAIGVARPASARYDFGSAVAASIFSSGVAGLGPGHDQS
jgi:hypothetical protein